MFNFNPERYEKVVEGALSKRKEIEKAADEISKKGFANIYFIGAGGTYAHSLSLKYMMDTTSSIQSYAVIAAEFILMGDKHFGSDSICIFSSRTGNTKEIVAAAEFCKKAGATVVSFVAKDGTPLCSHSDYVIVNYAEDDHLGESIYLQNIPFILRLMYNKGDFPGYQKFQEELSKIFPYLIKVKQQVEDYSKNLAESHKDTDYHMVVGSGNLWGEAYDYAMCILEEMQWIKAKSIHAAEFFHGTLELVEEDTSILLLYGEDETRPLMDRVKNFVSRFSKNLSKFDTKEAELPMSYEFRKFVAPVVIYAMLERFSCHLEEVRNHSLNIRRYYRQMEY